MTSPITKSPQDTAMLADEMSPLSPGQVQWHSSEEDGGPDVGISIGLGGGFELWFGELLSSEGRFGFAVCSPSEKCAVAAHDDYHAVRELLEDHVAPALRNPPPGVEREAVERVVHENGPVVVDFMGDGLAWRPLDYGTWTAFSPPPPIEPDMVADEPPIGGERVLARELGQLMTAEREALNSQISSKDHGPLYRAYLARMTWLDANHEAILAALSPAPADGGDDGSLDAELLMNHEPTPVAQAVEVERPLQGQAGDAIDFALDHIDDPWDRVDFLESWRSDDVSQWPEYVTWLGVQYRSRTPDPIAESSQTEGEGK